MQKMNDGEVQYEVVTSFPPMLREEVERTSELDNGERCSKKTSSRHIMYITLINSLQVRSSARDLRLTAPVNICHDAPLFLEGLSAVGEGLPFLFFSGIATDMLSMLQ